MELAEIILSVRSRAEQLARLARILARIKPTLQATGTTVDFADQGRVITFRCQTENDAVKIGEAIHLVVELRYQGRSTVKQMGYELDGITYHFQVQTIRLIRCCACEVKRKRRPASTEWYEAALYFCGMEIAKLSYRAHQSPSDLKRALWDRAVADKARNTFLDNYDLVL